MLLGWVCVAWRRASLPDVEGGNLAARKRRGGCCGVREYQRSLASAGFLPPGWEPRLHGRQACLPLQIWRAWSPTLCRRLPFRTFPPCYRMDKCPEDANLLSPFTAMKKPRQNLLLHAALVAAILFLNLPMRIARGGLRTEASRGLFRQVQPAQGACAGAVDPQARRPAGHHRRFDHGAKNVFAHP